MKILVRLVDDWMEVYIDGKFIMDASDLYFDFFIKTFLINMRDRLSDIDVRVYRLKYLDMLTGMEDYMEKYLNDDTDIDLKDYNPPVHTIQGHFYWDDWNSAVSLDDFLETEDE